MRRKSWIVALLLVVALAAAACAEEDTNGGNGNGRGGDEVDFTACQVTDTGGVDDKSFNQTAYKGLQDAEDQLGVEISVLESQSATDFEPHIQTFIDQGCDMIVTVGFLLGDATDKAAKTNPDQNFAIVDFNFFDADGNDVVHDNVKELTFQTDEAAFLAGYLAAGMSESGKLGTFGGLNIPTVTIFMDGFEAGMNYYNEQKNANVTLQGWNAAKQRGTFTDSFEDLDKGEAVTEGLLQAGADIILPVAGPVGEGSAAAVEAAGGNAKLVWVDTDGCVSAENYCPLFLTSVLKNMDVAVFDTIKAAVDGDFEGGLYTGTLDNDGVGIAPYHDFEDEVPDELKAEINEIRQGIIDGSISVSQ